MSGSSIWIVVSSRPPRQAIDQNSPWGVRIIVFVLADGWNVPDRATVKFLLRVGPPPRPADHAWRPDHLLLGRRLTKKDGSDSFFDPRGRERELYQDCGWASPVLLMAFLVSAIPQRAGQEQKRELA